MLWEKKLDCVFLLQLLRRLLEHGFAAKLQKCFVDY